MKATDSKGSRLEVDFIIDITGSMGTQIDGVKRMVKSFCSEERDGIGIHITTYTENSSGCYVCHSKPGLTSSELVDYVEKIRLGKWWVLVPAYIFRPTTRLPWCQCKWRRWP